MTFSDEDIKENGPRGIPCSWQSGEESAETPKNGSSGVKNMRKPHRRSMSFSQAGFAKRTQTNAYHLKKLNGPVKVLKKTDGPDPSP